MAANRSEKLFLTAFRRVREYIIQEGLGPGDLLPAENAMATALGVSRNVVREAIKSMELMGMVRAVPGYGTEICPFSLDFVMQNVLFFHVDSQSPEEVRQMFDIRKNLEMSYMRQAFESLTAEDIRELRAIVDRIRLAWEEEGLFAELDRQFHMKLFARVGNGVLLSVFEAIWSVDVCFQLEMKRPHLEGSVVKHEAIVDALEKYDYLAFAMAMARHFSSGKYTDGNYTE